MWPQERKSVSNFLCGANTKIMEYKIIQDQI